MSGDDKRREAARCRRQQRIRDKLVERYLLELETLLDDHTLADELAALERLLDA